MKLLNYKTYGVDLYDMPLKAIEADGTLTVDTHLEEALLQIPKGIQSKEKAEEYIASRKHWGDFELTQGLLKYVQQKSNKSIIRPNLFVSVPKDAIDGPFGGIFHRMISEAGISAGFRAVYVIENVMCAAIGAGVPVRELNKMLFLYANSWCTYLTVIFSGGFTKTKIIEKPISAIKKEELINIIENLVENLPERMPLSFSQIGYKENMRESIDSAWSRTIESKLYAAVPDAARLEYGSWLGKYSVEYAKDYQNTIINGLSMAACELTQEIKK